MDQARTPITSAIAKPSGPKTCPPSSGAIAKIGIVAEDLKHSVHIGPAGRGMSYFQEALHESLVSTGGSVNSIEKG